MGPSGCISIRRDDLGVSIPQSEFCPLGPLTVLLASTPSPRVSIPQSEFCPLGLVDGGLIDASAITVSIPQSEFCPLGHLKISVIDVRDADVSIPQSEFCPLGPEPFLMSPRLTPMFQFLSRNSVRWDALIFGSYEGPQLTFQFLSRNSVRWDRRRA